MFKQFCAALALLVLAPLAGADAWTDTVQEQQRTLYRLLGTFYMTTHEDAERDLIAALPQRVDEYRKALAACNTAASADRGRAQAMAAVTEAWTPIETLVTRDLQKVIATEQKKYINNGVFNAFQRATDVNNHLPALEAANARALGAVPAERKAVLMQGAVAAEALAAQYARMATGYFDETQKPASGATLASAARDFAAALDKARAQVDRKDALQRAALDRIEARWKFVQPVLQKPVDQRPRLAYRYLGEIGENFLKLANPL